MFHSITHPFSSLPGSGNKPEFAQPAAEGRFSLRLNFTAAMWASSGQPCRRLAFSRALRKAPGSPGEPLGVLRRAGLARRPGERPGSVLPHRA